MRTTFDACSTSIAASRLIFFLVLGGRGVSRPAASAMLRLRPSLVRGGGRSMRVASLSPLFAAESDLPVLPSRGAPSTPRTGRHAERAPVALLLCVGWSSSRTSSSVLATTGALRAPTSHARSLACSATSSPLSADSCAVGFARRGSQSSGCDNHVEPRTARATFVAMHRSSLDARL
jgi:hypothetical protein